MNGFQQKTLHNSATYYLDVMQDEGTNSTSLVQMVPRSHYSIQYLQAKSNDDEGIYSTRILCLRFYRQVDCTV